MVAFCVAMLGLFGSGYCEHETFPSAAIPDAVHGYTNGIYLKGAVRYVGNFNSHVCAISPSLTFSGIGVCLLIGGVYYWLLRRLP